MRITASWVSDSSEAFEVFSSKGLWLSECFTSNRRVRLQECKRWSVGFSILEVHVREGACGFRCNIEAG